MFPTKKRRNIVQTTQRTRRSQKSNKSIVMVRLKADPSADQVCCEVVEAHSALLVTVAERCMNNDGRSFEKFPPFILYSITLRRFEPNA